jgi:hypothetical protein
VTLQRQTLEAILDSGEVTTLFQPILDISGQLILGYKGA